MAVIETGTDEFSLQINPKICLRSIRLCTCIAESSILHGKTADQRKLSRIDMAIVINSSHGDSSLFGDCEKTA
jgi:hypothetical protein